MTTALNIIERALLDLKVLGEGENASAQQGIDGLIYLNDLIQSWSNQGLLINAVTTDIVTFTGATSYTFGTGGTINSSRPTTILSAYCTQNGTDYQIQIINVDQYQSIADKDSTGDLPSVVYINYTYPLATVYVYPVPSSGTLSLTSQKPLTEQATQATVLSFPAGYERALRLNLAVEMMNQYCEQPIPMIIQMADEAKRMLKRQNLVNNPIKCALGLPTGYQSFGSGGILSGP